MSTSWVVDDLVDDAAELFDGPLDDLVAVLEEIASLGDVEAPTPSAELALLLAGRPAAAHRPARRTASGRWVPARGHRRLAPVLGGLAAAAVAGVTLTGTAAYANELPPSVQRVVAHLSEDYLPFTFPRPLGDPPAPERATPRGAGARSSGRATPGTDPSAVAKSGAVPVAPSTGSPTDRADGRLLRQALPKVKVPRPSTAPPLAPVRPDTGPSTIEQDTGASALTMTPEAPPAQASEPAAGPTASATASPVDPQATPSGATTGPPSADPAPSPVPSPSTDPASGAASGPPSAPASEPPSPITSSGSQPSTTPSTGTTPATGSDPANGKTSPTVGPATTPDSGPTTTTPPGGPTDQGGSQPAGQVSASPDTSPSTPAVGSGGSPAADVVTDPGTAGSAVPTTVGSTAPTTPTP
jgi:hypothetical protein